MVSPMTMLWPRTQPGADIEQTQGVLMDPLGHPGNHAPTSEPHEHPRSLRSGPRLDQARQWSPWSPSSVHVGMGKLIHDAPELARNTHRGLMYRKPKIHILLWAFGAFQPPKENLGLQGSPRASFEPPSVSTG
jgi:hypothetical protein